MARWFTYSGTFTTSLMAITLDQFGSQMLDWHPLTLEMEIKDEFNVDPPDHIMDRLMVGIALLKTDNFFNSVVDFSRWCMTLSGHYLPQERFALPDSDDIAWGITEGMMLASPDAQSDGSYFSLEIAKFIGVILDAEGIINAPDVLKIAQRADPTSQIAGQFDEDPEMFQMVWQYEQEKTDSILNILAARTKALITQVAQLPLSGGKNKKFADDLLRKLKLPEVEPMDL